MGLKYICKFRGLNSNRLWQVNVYMPGYSGMPINKLGIGENTCVISWDRGDRLFEKFVMGSSASITMLFDNQSEVDELQNIGDKTCKVIIYDYEDEESPFVYWQGYLVSDGIQCPDSGVSFPVTMNAVDMLEASNDMPFVNVDNVGAITVTGQVGSINSPINWIRKCLIYEGNISNNLPILWSCSLKNSQYPDDDFFGGRTSLIYNFEEFINSRQETTVGWMLENILKSSGCILYQYEGFWNVISLKDLAQLTTLTTRHIGERGEELDFAAKTAQVGLISPRTALPTQINENTYNTTQKPVSRIKSTYNHSMNSNIIPNGGFDILGDNGLPIYWKKTTPILLSAEPSLNNRGGYSLRAKNNSFFTTQYINFGIDDINSIPFDANILFKNMQWGFTFMPVNYPTNSEGFIDWSLKPLEIAMSYTGYLNNVFFTFYLNEFGYWYNRSSDGSDGLRVDEAYLNTPLNRRGTVVLSGSAIAGDIYKVDYVKDFGPPAHNTEDVSFTVNFTIDMSLSAAATKIADETGGIVDLSDIADGVAYVYYDNNSIPMYWEFLSFSAGITRTGELEPKIAFIVDGLKNNDIASVQFQSKGNQGNVLMPDPGALNEMRALEAGKLSMKIFVHGNDEVYFDDVYMNVSDSKDVWELSDGGSDGVQEVSLDISSSFSGFMTSSYMDNFAKSDLSMIMDNGTDRGALTEIFGKTALRFLSRPTKKVDTEVEGIGFQFNIYGYKGKNFVPLKISANLQGNSTSLTMAEFSYNSTLAISSVHKSSSEGSNSSSGGGYGGGGSSGGGGGAEFLFELGDVSINSPEDAEALIYNTANGKWENSSITVNISSVIGLQSALDAKANDNTVVKLTGDQLVYGEKTFADVLAANNANIGVLTVNSDAYLDGNATVLGTLTAELSGNAATVTTINGKISAGSSITITGSGTAASPYVINSIGGGDQNLQEVTDNGDTTTNGANFGNHVGIRKNSGGLLFTIGEPYATGSKELRFVVDPINSNVELSTYTGNIAYDGNLILQRYGGNVGIGTNSPSEKVEISGNVKANNFIGNLSGNAATVTTINGKISAGSSITITGSGTAASPYVITAFASGPAVGSLQSVTANGSITTEYITIGGFESNSDAQIHGNLDVDSGINANNINVSDGIQTENIIVNASLTTMYAQVSSAPVSPTDVVRLEDIGGGKILSGSASLNFGNFAAGQTKIEYVTISGVSDSDVICIGLPKAFLEAGPELLVKASYWSSNTIAITVYNTYSSSITTSSGTFKVKVFK